MKTTIVIILNYNSKRYVNPILELKRREGSKLINVN